MRYTLEMHVKLNKRKNRKLLAPTSAIEKIELRMEIECQEQVMPIKNYFPKILDKKPGIIFSAILYACTCVLPKKKKKKKERKRVRNRERSDLSEVRNICLAKFSVQ